MTDPTQPPTAADVDFARHLFHTSGADDLAGLTRALVGDNADDPGVVEASDPAGGNVVPREGNNPTSTDPAHNFAAVLFSTGY